MNFTLVVSLISLSFLGEHFSQMPCTPGLSFIRKDAELMVLRYLAQRREEHGFGVIDHHAHPKICEWGDIANILSLLVHGLLSFLGL
jgi:hypothetical protein